MSGSVSLSRMSVAIGCSFSVVRRAGRVNAGYAPGPLTRPARPSILSFVTHFDKMQQFQNIAASHTTRLSWQFAETACSPREQASNARLLGDFPQALSFYLASLGATRIAVTFLSSNGYNVLLARRAGPEQIGPRFAFLNYVRLWERADQ